MAKKKPIQSQRPDGRGHWPKGKRRNRDIGRWSKIRMAVARFIEDNHKREWISQGQLAVDVGSDSRSINRYLSGRHRPSEELQLAIEQWLVEKRDQLKQSKAK